MSSTRKRPTKEELVAAEGQPVPDLLAPGLKVVFCGINPSVYSAVVGHHFARPGNRFWPTLHAAGFTHRLFSPYEDEELLRLGYGLTNVASPATVAAADLSPVQLSEGGRQLEAKMRQFHPQWLAILGISVYRTVFAQPKATLGPQQETIGGVSVWVLPNPSGLNAHYTPKHLAQLFGDLRRAVDEASSPPHN